MAFHENPHFPEIVSASNSERREKPRITCSYPATLRGHPRNLTKNESRAVLSNMSAGGLFIRTNRQVEIGESLFIVVRLSTTPLNDDPIPRLAAVGDVVRIEPKADGTRGVALKLNRHRFL